MQHRSFETKICMKNKVFLKFIINKMHWNLFPGNGVWVISIDFHIKMVNIDCE